MIIVCPLHAAPHLVIASKASHAISLLSPESEFPNFHGLAAERHLRLALHDIAIHTPGMAAPHSQDAEKLVRFVDGWDVQAPMLIHCWAGISRSTASAFTALCIKRPDEDEEALAWELREASASATPNPLLIAHADSLLGREGRMSAAIKAIGRGEDAFEGVPFQLKV
jgi:predicted protein tyrosine phosphatase